MSKKRISAESITFYDLLTTDVSSNIIQLNEDNAYKAYDLIPNRETFFSTNGLFANIEKRGLIEQIDENQKSVLDINNLYERLNNPKTSHVVLIEGFAGCGKSTLIQYILSNQLNTYNYDYNLFNYDLEAKYNIISRDENGRLLKRSSIYSAIKKSFFEQFVKFAHKNTAVIDDYFSLLKYCKEYQPFNELFYRFAVTDTFKYILNLIQEDSKEHEYTIFDNLTKQSDQLLDRECILALDYLFRLSLYKNRIINKLYICYDNLDAIEDAEDLINFDNTLVSFRKHIDEFIGLQCEKDFFNNLPTPHFIIIATYRKITANMAGISERFTEVESDDDFFDFNTDTVIHIDATSAFSYKNIVSKRNKYFSERLKNILGMSKEKQSNLVDTFNSWEMLNNDLSIMKNHYSSLWNKNYRTCSLIAEKLYSNNYYNFKDCVKFIENKQNISDGFDSETDFVGHNILFTYYGGSSILLNNVCKVFNDNKIWSSFLDLAELKTNSKLYKNVSLSRLILTYMHNSKSDVSLEELYYFFCKDDMFSYGELCHILSKMLERNKSGVWRRPIYYANGFILSEKAKDIERALAKECEHISKAGKASEQYSFILCDSGRAYVERLTQEFEFFSNRICNSNNCLYLYNSIDEIDRIINDVYNAVSCCCDNLNELRIKYLDINSITNEQYLTLRIHPTTYFKNSHQLHEERIIFSHIAYLNRVRLYFIDELVSPSLEERIKYNRAFVKHIKNYLNLFKEKILPITTQREKVYNSLLELVEQIEIAQENGNIDEMFQSIDMHSIERST